MAAEEDHSFINQFVHILCSLKVNSISLSCVFNHMDGSFDWLAIIGTYETSWQTNNISKYFYGALCIQYNEIYIYVIEILYNSMLWIEKHLLKKTFKKLSFLLFRAVIASLFEGNPIHYSLYESISCASH